MTAATTVEDGSPAAQHWVAQRKRRSVPQEILDAAPEGRPGLDVGRFARRAEALVGQDTPSVRVAREVLPEGGAVLDVGCGGGAAGLPLAPPAGMVIGFDGRPDMLSAFAELATTLGVRHHQIQGTWPNDAVMAPPVDVVVCHNVFYGIDDLGAFATELTAHARARVVVQIPQVPPRAWMGPYWTALHGIDVPAVPTADDAVAVLREAGIDVQVERWEQDTTPQAGTSEDTVEVLRRQLCVGPERDEEIRALLERHPPPTSRPTVTLWWSV